MICKTIASLEFSLAARNDFFKSDLWISLRVSSTGNNAECESLRAYQNSYKRMF